MAEEHPEQAQSKSDVPVAELAQLMLQRKPRRPLPGSFDEKHPRSDSGRFRNK